MVLSVLYCKGVGNMLNKETTIELKKELLVDVYENMIYAISVTDARNKIQLINPAFTELTGYSEDDVIGKNPSILSSGIHEKHFYKEMWRSLNKKGFWRGEIWNKRKDGELFLEEITIKAIKNNNGKIKNYVSIFIDITERKKLEEKLKFQAYHDDLTKLPNRKYFYYELNQVIQRTDGKDKLCAVIFLDLDHFKDINDTLGHSVGDELLIAAANRLRERLQNKGVVTRYGGDEFAIILYNLQNKFECISIMNRIMDSFSKPFTLHGFELFITTSVGISLYPNDGDDGDTLIKYADSAMYHAKQEARILINFFKRVI